MSLTALVWICTFVGLTVLSLRRPVWAVGAYWLTFFAHPSYWWWGDPFEGGRWNLYAGIILLIAVALGGVWPLRDQDRDRRRTSNMVLLILANATFVHAFLASNLAISATAYVELAKCVLLFFLIIAAVRTRGDFAILVLILSLGAGYFGFEATINDRGRLRAARLEGIGGPGAASANQLASCVVTILPLVGGLLFLGRKWEKFLAVLIAPLALNVVLLCNSRGALLSLIGAAFVLLATARGRLRRKAFAGLALGGIAAYLLLGDPQIMQRFSTTFVSAEERDTAAAGRLVFWKAGLAMVRDYPLGAGGDSFKEVHGERYLKDVGVDVTRSVHNGYINEACQWGIQGLLLRLAFLGGAALCAFKTMAFHRNTGDVNTGFMGACILASMVGFMGTSVFGTYLDNEWGYWIAAIAMAYSRLHGPGTTEDEMTFEEETSEEVDDPMDPVLETPVTV